MEPSICGGGRRYCALCKNYGGKILEDGSTVMLHRIPGGPSQEEKRRRSLWLQKIKLVRPDIIISSNTRVCNLHFDGNVCRPGSVPVHLNLQKVTPEKRFRRPLVRHVDENCKPDLACENQFDGIQNSPDVPLFSKSVIVQCCPESVSTSTQTEVISSESDNGLKMLPEDIYQNDEKTRYYTGFPNYATFMLFFQTLLSHGANKLCYWDGEKRTKDVNDRRYKDDFIGKPGRKRTLRPLDEFYMVCLRLRQGLLQEFLADLFGVSVMTVSRILNTWINFLYDHMRSLIPWPTKEQILSNLPVSFSEMPDVRIVIDATEFFCEKPSSLGAQYLTWSEYKHHNTFKVLIGVAPNGLVTFISRVWGGRASDRHIVQYDGDLLLPLLEYGDVILADKGFTVSDLLPAHIGLNRPPFVAAGSQMSSEEFFKTQQIAAPRIVVEMKMEQIKNFRILQSVLPLSEAHLAEKIILICTAMTNLYEPLLK